MNPLPRRAAMRVRRAMYVRLATCAQSLVLASNASRHPLRMFAIRVNKLERAIRVSCRKLAIRVVRPRCASRTSRAIRAALRPNGKHVRPLA